MSRWIAVFLTLSTGALAAPRYLPPSEANTLKAVPGIELANQYCRACHSTDYITTQPPRVAAGFWQAEVTKMTAVFGAKIPEPEAKRIVDYLNAAYRQPEPASSPPPAKGPG